jgi:fructokinase
MAKLIVIGESLIDKIFDKEYVGGAPLNVCCYASKYIHTVFLNMLSEDYMSKNILNTLVEYNVDTSYIKYDKESSTCYSLVSLDKDNNRHFSFNYKNASFTKYKSEYIDKNLFQEGDMFYFGSVFFLSENGIESTKKCIQYCKEKSIKIAFDINYRDKLYPNINQFNLLIEPFLKQINILKVSNEEYPLIFNNLEVEDLFNVYPNLETIILTLGDQGACLLTKDKKEYYPSKKVNPVDTTGCGDAFIGTYLGMLLTNKYEEDEILNKCIDVSSKVATCKGALLDKGLL